MNRNFLWPRNHGFLALILLGACLMVLAVMNLPDVFALSSHQDPYPAPGVENGYYPSPEFNNNPIDAAQPGVEADELELPVVFPEPNQTASGGGSGGLLILWLGFIATLLILFAAIIGSILLFTRRNDN